MHTIQIKDFTMSKDFLYRFPDENVKREFKIHAANQDKTMTELLGEIVTRYLEETKRVKA